MQLEILPDIVYYAFGKAKTKGIPFMSGPSMNMDLSRLEGLLAAK